LGSCGAYIAVFSRFSRPSLYRERGLLHRPRAGVVLGLGLGLAEALPPRRLTRCRHLLFPRAGLGARQLLWSDLPDGEDDVGEEQDRLTYTWSACSAADSPRGGAARGPGWRPGPSYSSSSSRPSRFAGPPTRRSPRQRRGPGAGDGGVERHRCRLDDGLSGEGGGALREVFGGVEAGKGVTRRQNRGVSEARRPPGPWGARDVLMPPFPGACHAA
jgi:hypothetical protein